MARISGIDIIRRFDEFRLEDWKPFIEETESFETARIPSNLLYIALECHKSFSGLLDLIKETASGLVNNVTEIEEK